MPRKIKELLEDEQEETVPEEPIVEAAPEPEAALQEESQLVGERGQSEPL